MHLGKALAKGDETQEEPEGGGGHELGGRQRQMDGSLEPPSQRQPANQSQLDWLLYGLGSLGLTRICESPRIGCPLITVFLSKYREISHHPLIIVHIGH